mmetsp:Transcript_1922/g.3199  ORF Transcript_1922/g.3199 Transcript_1922/m.3199 type:complete len:97 (-) Transcript_1922:291-581(-)
MGSPQGYDAGEVHKKNKGRKKNRSAHLPDIGTLTPTTLPDVSTRKPNLRSHTNVKSGKITASTAVGTFRQVGPEVTTGPKAWKKHLQGGEMVLDFR